VKGGNFQSPKYWRSHKSETTRADVLRRKVRYISMPGPTSTYPHKHISLKRIEITLRSRGDFPLSVKRVIARVPIAIQTKMFVGLNSTAKAAERSDSLRLQLVTVSKPVAFVKVCQDIYLFRWLPLLKSPVESRGFPLSSVSMPKSSQGR